jgi:Protein of unknown function (DUF1571)
MSRIGPRASLRLARTSLAGALLLGAALVLQPAADGQDAKGQAPPTAVTPPATENPLDQPLAWLQEAKRNYTAVQDYACTLVSRETVRGVLKDENVISFKMRTQPFSVSMRWLAPKKLQGQEVCFVWGKNNNKMRVHSTTLGARIAGFVSIDTNDPRVMEHSRHTIVEAGIGNLIEQTAKTWDTERKANKTQVKVAEYTYNNRRCYRIETTRAERRPEHYCYRSVLYLDKDSKLPVRNENYDWPRAGGSTDGELMEMYSYVDLRFNVGLSDQDFNR